MDERIDEVLRKITSIEDSLKKAKPKWYERIFWAVEKALIPIMIAVLAYYGNQAATKISERQLVLAKSNAEDRKAEFRRTMQSKYLEMFQRDIVSADPRQQASALGLLRLMDPALASDASTLVQTSTQISPAVKAEVRVEAQKVEAAAQTATRPQGTGILARYKIGIYYLSNDAASVRTAQAIQLYLRQQGLSNLIALYPSNQEFMDSVVPPSALEVRFEEGMEDKQAQALVIALDRQPIARRANLVPVGNQTPNFISVFVPSGG
jgi:hypothetical protein